MADSFITVPPDSTGKSLDTRTVPDGNHREVITVGSPTLADVAEVDAANGLDVDVTRLPALVAGTANIGDVDVLTVPAPLSTAGGGTEATALRVTLASDSTGLVSVDDNGGSLTVDGTVAISGSVDTELPAAAALADNAANPTAPAVGAFGMVWDGATWDRLAGTSVDGALVNLGANNDVGLNAGTNNIGDVDVLTVPAPLSTTGGGTEATALRVTVANDSTGVVSVDDNGGSLTVDGTVAVSGTVDTELPAAAALADTTANPTTPLVGVAAELFNGTTWDRMRGDITNGLDVDVTRLPALVAGTANIGDVDVLTVPAPLNVVGGGTEAAALRVTLANDSTGLVSVDDNAGSLTVDNPILSVVGGGTEAAAQRVTIANDSTGVVSVDDNGGSLTVDGTVTANPTAKVILSASGSASTSGNNTLVAAGTNRLKVFAFSLTTLSTTAMTCIFQSGAGGTELWRVVIQAPTSVSTGANLTTAIPGWLFATATATLLNLNLSSANAVHWSVSYFDEA